MITEIPAGVTKMHMAMQEGTGNISLITRNLEGIMGIQTLILLGPVMMITGENRECSKRCQAVMSCPLLMDKDGTGS